MLDATKFDITLAGFEFETRQALYIKMQHWGAFLKPLLQWKSNKYYIL